MQVYIKIGIGSDFRGITLKIQPTLKAALLICPVSFMIRNRTGFYLSCLSLTSFLLVILLSDRFDRMPTNLADIILFVGFYILMLSAVLSALALLGIMIFDFFEYRKNISLIHQLSILLLLLGLNWIGSILYFLFIYYPRHKPESGSIKF